jgi:hypothetical protein
VLNLIYVTIIASVTIVAGGIIWTVYPPHIESQNNENNTTFMASEPHYEEILVTNNVKHLVPLDEIKSGGPPKDGIPSIDRPKFVSAQNADFISADDLVIGLRIGNEVKAYPLFILVWHEIVNDRIGGIPVAVTYCPLCFTSQVFERIVNDEETEFGTSGKLYNSNLVMYDRNTDSMWSQALAKSIVGPLTGYELKRVPFDLARWSDWKTLYPDTVVLSTNTGFSRPYGVDPYGDYYTDSRIVFPVKHSDDRMHPKEIILGFHDDRSFKAYKMSDVESEKIINDQVGDQKLVLISVTPYAVRAFDRMIDGQALEFTYSEEKIMDKQTGSVWDFDGKAISGPLNGKNLQQIPYDIGFWFEWVAFYPSTVTYP